MWRKIKNYIQTKKKEEQLKKQIEVSYIIELVGEILELLEISERVFVYNKKLLDRIRKIRWEVTRMHQLIKKRNYEFLPLSTRVDMAKTLEHSKEQLEDSLLSVEPEVDKVQ